MSLSVAQYHFWPVSGDILLKVAVDEGFAGIKLFTDVSQSHACINTIELLSLSL